MCINLKTVLIENEKSVVFQVFQASLSVLLMEELK
jgi:hypothetical protein